MQEDGTDGTSLQGIRHYLLTVPVVLAVAWACHGRSQPEGSGLVSTEVPVFLS